MLQAMVQLAVAAWMDNAWIALMTVVPISVIARYAIAREERYLESLFGQAYLEYKQRVRCWN